jgi:hypothetical protein
MVIADGDVEVLHACPLCEADSLGVLDSNLCECKRCGYVFNNPRPTLAALISFYSQPTKYDQWLAEEPARDALWTRRLKLLRRIAKPGSLLDVGAGIGQFLSIALSLFQRGLRYGSLGKRYPYRSAEIQSAIVGWREYKPSNLGACQIPRMSLKGVLPFWWMVGR